MKAIRLPLRGTVSLVSYVEKRLKYTVLFLFLIEAESNLHLVVLLTFVMIYDDK